MGKPPKKSTKMTAKEYLKMRRDTDDRKPLLELEIDIEYRKALALEIIAEVLIDLTVTLENIETILNRR